MANETSEYWNSWTANSDGVRRDFVSALGLEKRSRVVIATFSGINKIASFQWCNYHYWSFSTLSAQRLFEKFLPRASLEVERLGNVPVGMAFLHGPALEEPHQEELDYRHYNHQVLITVRGVKRRVAL